MLNTIIHYEVIMNIALIVLVVCLATYTFAQDMRLKKYKLQLADLQSDSQWDHQQQSKYSTSNSHIAA